MKMIFIKKTSLPTILVATVVYSAYFIYYPVPINPTEDSPEVFSAERAYQHLGQTHSEPHPLGSAAHDSAVQYIVRTLVAMGVEPVVQQTTGILKDSAGYWPPNALWAVALQNIIATIPGTNSKGTILLMSHYDAMPTTCGASDGGTGTASLLEIARALKASMPLENDVVLFFSDADVNGCIGAETFKSQHPLAQYYDVAIKMEGMGTTGGVMLIYTTTNNYDLVRDFVSAVPYPYTMLFANDILNYMQMASSPDVNVMVRNRKAAGMGFGYAADPQIYHTMIDRPENIDAGVMQQYGENVLAFTRYLGNKELAAYHTEQPEAVAFSLNRILTIVYPSTWAIPSTLFVVLLLLAISYVGIRRKRISVTPLLKNLFMFLVWWVGAMLLCTLVMFAIKTFNPNYDAFLQGIYGFNWYLPMMIALSLALYCVLFRKSLADANGQTIWMAAMWWGALLLCFAAWAVPSLSYFYAIPLLGAMCLYGYQVIRQSNDYSFWGLLVYAVVVVLICTPPTVFMYLFSARYYSMGNFPYAFLAVFLLAWVIGMLTPIWLMIAKRADGTVSSQPAIIAAFLGVLFAIIGIVNSTFSEKQPYPNYVAYDYDADAQEAFWIAVGSKTDAYTKQWVGENPEKAKYEIFPAYFPDWLYDGWKADASLLNLPVPQVYLSGDTIVNNQRNVELSVAPGGKWNALRITLMSDHLGNEYVLGGQSFGTGKMADSLSNRLRIIFFNPGDTVRLSLKTGPDAEINCYLEAYRNGLPEVSGKSSQPRTTAMMPGMAEFVDPTVWKKSYRY